MAAFHDMTRAELEDALEAWTPEDGERLQEALQDALRWVCTKCGKPGADKVYDRYGIYYGTLCEPCEDASGIRNWVFDASYAGESLEEDY